MMKKFVEWFACVTCAFVLCVGVWEGLQPADAQSGGGYPSNPNFQSVKIKGNSVFAPQIVTLTSTSGRTSNTTLTLDSTLQESLAAGTWHVQFFGNLVAVTAAGMQATIYATNASLQYTAYAQCVTSSNSYQVTSTAGYITNALVTSTPTTANDCYVSTSFFPANSGQMTLDTVIVLSATATVGVTWAQVTSSAISSGWGSGSTLIATRLQ